MLLPWQIDIGFCQLFCHEIEIVPSRITEYSGVEGDSNSPRVSRCALIIKGSSITELEMSTNIYLPGIIKHGTTLGCKECHTSAHNDQPKRE